MENGIKPTSTQLTPSSHSQRAANTGTTNMSPEDLTERILLLEKAANQLESDNRDLATKLREALNQNELLQSGHKHDQQRLKSMYCLYFTVQNFYFTL